MSSTRRPTPLRFGHAWLFLLLFTPAVQGQPAGADAERGAARAKECMSCHGRPGRGPLSGMPSLAGQQPEFMALQLSLMQKKLRDVPEMADLLSDYSSQDFADIAAFFHAMKPPPPRGTRDPERHAAGAAVSAKHECASCHKPGYAGERLVPRITGQREDYLRSTLQAYRERRRVSGDDSMNAVAARLSDADIAALAHYLAHQ